MPTWMRNVFNLDLILTLSTSPNMRLASQKVRNISKGLHYIKTLQFTKKSEIYNRFENNSREPQSNNVLLFSMF